STTGRQQRRRAPCRSPLATAALVHVTSTSLFGEPRVPVARAPDRHLAALSSRAHSAALGSSAHLAMSPIRSPLATSEDSGTTSSDYETQIDRRIKAREPPQRFQRLLLVGPVRPASLRRSVRPELVRTVGCLCFLL